MLREVLKNKLSHLSLKTKIVTMFFVIMCGVVFLVYKNFSSLYALEQGVSEVLIPEINRGIKSKELKTKFFELKYLVSNPALMFTEKEKISKLIDSLTSQTKLSFAPDKQKELTYKLESLAKKIKESVSNVQSLNFKSGLDQFDNKAKALHSFIYKKGLSEYYLSALSSLKQSFKNYLLTGDSAFKNSFNETMKALKQRMKNRGLDKKLSDRVNQSLSEFKNIFYELSLNQEKNKAILDNLTNDIKAFEELSLAYNLESGFSLKKLQNKIRNLSQGDFSILVFTSAIIFLMIVLINFIMYRLTLKMSNEVIRLKDISSKFVVNCDKISSNSNNLRIINEEQSSAIEQTASSAKEISEMAKRNSESTLISHKKSEENTKEVQNSKKTIQEVLGAMDNLSKSSGHMAERFNQTSSELQDVVSIINQIGEKAKVINDIVFQTKLLSFNASVEAARAGEHGKGFSVVAQEIGNLADMSGTSAEEIARILEQSIKKVTDIVTNNQSDIDKLVSNNTQNISHGRETVKKCESSLNSIISNITSINQSIEEIASASKEQNTGVNEISDAIESLSKSNRKTTGAIGESVSYTNEIEDNAHQIYEMSNSLEKLIFGAKAKKKKESASVEFFDNAPQRGDKAA